VVLVSDDVASGPVPEDTLSRAFQRAQGEVNQRLAAHADLVVYVTAGLPQVLKGVPQLDAVDEPW
jgi:adenosylcobinamide kinase/adenosylcobinamide-phosphate guanylyltransferase